MSPGVARTIRLLLMIVLGLAAIAIEVAPLGHHPDAPPSPDLLFLVVAFFSIRRPGTAMLVAVFALGLIRDLLADLPVGAGALTLVVASEALKRLGPSIRRSGVILEVAAVAAAGLAMLLAQWLVVVLAVLPPPPLLLVLKQALVTVAVYPWLALAFRWLLGIGWRKPAVEHQGLKPGQMG